MSHKVKKWKKVTNSQNYIKHFQKIPTSRVPPEHNITITSCPNIVDHWIQANVYSSPFPNAVGFDTEWDFINQDAIHLFQISCQDHHLLFQVGTFTNSSGIQYLPEHFRKLLTDSNVKKVGFGVGHDEKKMVRLGFIPKGVKLGGFFDITTFYSKKFKQIPRGPIDGPKIPWKSSIAFYALGENYTPNPRFTTLSRWSSKYLSKEQISYAILDAYIPLASYHILINEDGLPTSFQQRVKLVEKLCIPSWDEQCMERYGYMVPLPDSDVDTFKAIFNAVFRCGGYNGPVTWSNVVQKHLKQFDKRTVRELREWAVDDPDIPLWVLNENNSLQVSISPEDPWSSEYEEEEDSSSYYESSSSYYEEEDDGYYDQEDY